MRVTETDDPAECTVLITRSHPAAWVAVQYFQVPAGCVAFGVLSGSWIFAGAFFVVASGVFYAQVRRYAFVSVEVAGGATLVKHRLLAGPIWYHLGPRSALRYERLMGMTEHAVLRDDDGRKLVMRRRESKPVANFCARVSGVEIDPIVHDIGVTT